MSHDHGLSSSIQRPLDVHTLPGPERFNQAT